MVERLRDLGVTVRIEVVPSGIDVARFAGGRRDQRLRSRLGVAAGDRLVLYVGRLAKEKNVELALRALTLAGDESLKLIVAGDGPHRAELERIAHESGVWSATRFLGALARHELPDLYASADAFVMPSTTETQGLVMAEALAAGARVIAAEAPQNRDVLGDAGTIVPPTPEAFAGAFAAIPEAGAPSPEARRKAESFSIDRQIDRMQALYESLRQPARIA
jgi:glycosyltransferase involved in cell wall biosynthesis